MHLYCVDEKPPMRARTKKFISAYVAQSPPEDTKDKTYISTYVEQAPPMPARTLVVSQHV
jgi:hypothetical protein